MTKRERKGAEADHSSAHPKGWPGIPGRSAEHEGDPNAPVREARRDGVTEQQRQLERDQHDLERR